MEDYFPSYTNFKSEKLEPNEHPEINKAKQFIKLQFEVCTVPSVDFVTDFGVFPRKSV